MSSLNSNQLDNPLDSVHITDLFISGEAPTETLDQKDEINSGYMNVNDDSQTFTPSISGYVTAISIYTNQTVAMVGPMRVYLLSPLGAVLSGNFFTIPLGPQWIKLVIADPIPFLIAGTQYSILFEPNNFGDLARMGYDTTGSYVGGSMGSDPTKDFMFRIYIKQAGTINFTDGALTGVTEDIVNNLSQTIVPASQAVNDFVYTSIAEARDFNLLAESLTTSSWYSLGYLPLTGTDSSQYWYVESNVFIMDKTTGQTSNVKFTTSWNSTSTMYPIYEIVSGRISAIRPIFRTYVTSTGNTLYIYVKLPADCIFTACNNVYSAYPATKPYGIGYFTYEGTGTNPAGAAGKTLKYNTTVDDAGHYAPKVVSFSGPFDTSPENANVYFSVKGSSCTMTISQITATGSSGTGYITAPAGTIPTKWMPYGNVTANMPHFPIQINNGSVISWGSCVINTSLDGGFTIETGNGGQFSPGGSGCGMYNTSLTWTIDNN
jgi:hypothetical protein